MERSPISTALSNLGFAPLPLGSKKDDSLICGPIGIQDAASIFGQPPPSLHESTDKPRRVSAGDNGKSDRDSRDQFHGSQLCHWSIPLTTLILTPRWRICDAGHLRAPQHPIPTPGPILRLLTSGRATARPP